MMGARPVCLTAGFVLEEGLPIDVLDRVVRSMAAAARLAGVPVVAGDTKVVERGKADGLYVNTTAIGALDPEFRPGPARAMPGDVDRHERRARPARHGDHGRARGTRVREHHHERQRVPRRARRGAEGRARGRARAARSHARWRRQRVERDRDGVARRHRDRRAGRCRCPAMCAPRARCSGSIRCTWRTRACCSRSCRRPRRRPRWRCCDRTSSAPARSCIGRVVEAASGDGRVADGARRDADRGSAARGSAAEDLLGWKLNGSRELRAMRAQL